MPENIDNNHHKHSHGHHDHSAHLGLNTGSDASEYLNKAFTIGIILNIIFVIVEFTSGILLNSVALISDAGHNLSDVVSLGLALLAFRLSRTRPTDKYTYGHKKSTIVASLTNACILLIAIGVILYESIDKLMHPHPVSGSAIAWVAGIGIIINGFTAWLFLRHKNKDLNVKGAYLHMAADTLVSVGVLISGIVINLTGWYQLDPIIGIIIVVVIFIATWGLLKDSIRLALDGVPPGIDISQIKADMLSSDHRIQDIHHIHIWAISTTENAITAHIIVNSLNDAPDIKCNLKNVLKSHGIGHATIEIELERCQEPKCDCE